MGSVTHNPAFELAVQFVNQTSRSVFLTGKAGTGKTTFLKFIRENTFKKMAVTAPTGVAAINAGGTTLHSFFQLPFGPYLPAPQPYFSAAAANIACSDPISLFRNIRLNSAKRELLQELELLIIDEISMVRADTLDAIDTVLRHFRQQPLLPFGGLQLLYIGDLFQLPPVVTNAEWELLQQYYASPFFFDAKVFTQAQPACLELKKIYRQNEARFIDLLNNIRNNHVTESDVATLTDYYQPDFVAPAADQYITLTSHNAKADQINRHELSMLPGTVHTYNAAVTGEFSDKAYPAEQTLSLKEGAQIMLIKNDKGETRRYYNGKIGTVARLTADRITIRFPDEPDELILEKETWKNIRYNYDKDKDRVDEEELGSFSQYPIRLAWAITIHKSQGLTFKKAVIDAGDSFAPGQVYVALSRLTSLDGLVLRSRITPWSIRTDPRVAGFMENNPSNQIVEQQLEHDQRAFISDSLLKAFDWSRLTEQLQEHDDDYAKPALALQDTARRFVRQLEQLLPDAEADNYQRLHERTIAAVSYFVRQLDDQLLSPLTKHIAKVRSLKRKKKYWQQLVTLKITITRKRQQLEDALQLINGLRKGISTSRLLSSLENDRRSRSTPPPSAGPDNPTPDKSSPGKPTKDKSSPDNPTPHKPASPRPAEEPPPGKGSTRHITLQLYKEGIPIPGIAARRNLTIGTIEGHLASFIPTGEIDIKELVPEHKVIPILTVVREIGGSALGAMKSRLGDDYSYAEIKAVLHYSKQLPTP
ncbi:MAG TPA: helix-turn-helix domain-containing protein [Puia sp.]|nr:helix-turn-helix domain-containing protein [Puia sp.]